VGLDSKGQVLRFGKDSMMSGLPSKVLLSNDALSALNAGQPVGFIPGAIGARRQSVQDKVPTRVSALMTFLKVESPANQEQMLQAFGKIISGLGVRSGVIKVRLTLLSTSTQNIRGAGGGGDGADSANDDSVMPVVLGVAGFGFGAWFLSSFFGGK
ncbi:MAG: hypothetical protein HRT44_06895, partial [Bdellovibrionales bacterium]|nr:hypothetical protein [Bdellovibrionales bacterium]